MLCVGRAIEIGKGFLPKGGGEVINVTPCHESWQGVWTCLNQGFAVQSSVEMKGGSGGLVIGLCGG